MYTEPQKVWSELADRRKNRELLDQVLDYLGGSLPGGWPEDKPIATLNRYVATARLEDVVFAHSAASLNLWPYWPTYLAERFTSTNPEKVSCVRPRVHRPKLQASRSWLVKDHQQLPGQTLGGIRVGEVSLPEVHDQARQLVLDPEMSGNTFDVSTWNQAQAVRFGSNGSGRLAPHYYHAVMALYVCHGVLFEDFDGGPNAESGLGSFVAEVVRPAFEAVSQTFGVKPLIVRLPYTAGFLDYPGACAAVFDRFRE